MAETDGRYHGLLEAAPDAMVVVNERGEIVFLNVQAEKHFGYRREELVGQQVRIIIPAGFAERLLADGLRSPADALAQRIDSGLELTGLRKDGSEFPIEIMLSPLQGAEGILVTAAIRDITARKNSERHLAEVDDHRRVVEEALRGSEEQFRMLLDGIRDYAIFMMDPTGHIVSWNSGAERIKGYSSAEILGRSFACFFTPEDVASGRPEEILRLTEANERHEEQGMRVRKDGSRFLASLTFSALRDPQGRLRGFSEFSHDLSESRDSEARYRGLLEAAPDAMVVVNQRGEIVLLNVQAEKQFGYRRDELLGQQVTNIIPEGFAERLIADALRSAEDALAQSIGTGIELTGCRKNGSQFPLEIMLSPLESAEGILVTAAIRDITDRKRGELALRDKNTELKRANQAKDRFLASMSHELRTPLNGIIGFSEFLADGKPGAVNEKQKEYLGDILTSGRHLLQLINDMLDMVQVQAGKLKLNNEPFPLSAIVDEVCAGVRPLAENKHIEMVSTIAPGLGEVVLDKQRCRQILYNLLSNALKFTDDEGRVEVEASLDGPDRFRLSVRDNGIGIKQTEMHRLFSEFEQLETGSARRFGGTGLGLALTREIVTLMGGSISVESEIGRGSTFAVILPRIATGEPS
ncbi:MAG: PAS domain S-box protein [Acidobacteriota bacterium]